MVEPLVKVEGLKKFFPLEKKFLSRFFAGEERKVHAVDGVSFQVNMGETFSLVGETGSGKTTIGRLILRLIEPTEGKIFFGDVDLLSLKNSELHDFRRNAQMIFQDPLSSLNPRIRVEDTIGLPLKAHGIAKGNERKKLVVELMETVGLSPPEQLLDKYPYEFSGGQQQRIGIARALALKPKFIVADEPVSSLDVSIRAQILNLMQDIKRDFGLTYLLIAHDLSVVKYMSDRILILYLGKPMELASVDELFNNPIHPYTKALISAIPTIETRLKQERIKLKGEIPSAVNPKPGCRFQSRCPDAKPKCSKFEPELIDIGDNHLIACHTYQ